MDERPENNKRNKESRFLWYLYLGFTLCAFVILGRIAYIQCVFRDSDPYLKYYRTPNNRKKLDPVRGSIIASDGRLLAISTPMYQIYMDCTVRQAEFEKSKTREKAKEKEEEWRNKAAQLSKGLATIYGDRSADKWFKAIMNGRNNGSKYLKIGGPIDHETLQKVKKLPLFNEGPNKGGIITEQIDTRQYPYGSLARRVIGYVKDNSRSNGNNHIGLEGAFDYTLHGKGGYEWLKQTDGRKKILNKDSLVVEPQDGMDLRTTLNIDIQDIADNAIRKQIADIDNIEGGCVIVMDVKTGAIRAMVNLKRDSTTNRLGETYNMAIGRTGEPGSVFKTAILMSVMEDAKVKLSDELPTNHGRIKYFAPDVHITDYERQKGTDKMTVMHGFEISSNYVFRKLAIDHYGDNPKKLLDNLYMYKLGEAYDFDLQGFSAPTLPTSDVKKWSATDLGSMAIGYSVSETPLHIVTFYNAIANKGKMMKPYLVESIEKDGVIKEKRGPSVLNGSICSRATADSLTRGLMKITEEGTAARRLKGAKFKVAGKTGTARIAQEPKNAMRGNPYKNKKGQIQYQATFVGFFPAEQPKYTAIVVIYSKPSNEVFFGGTTPALTYRDIVDKIYALDYSYGDIIEAKGKMPDMSGESPKTAKNGKVPNLIGLGLTDAIYAIENDGYRCSYSGVGHVVSQSPTAGSKLSEGNIISIKLQ